MFSVLIAVGESALRHGLCEILENNGYHCYPAETSSKTLFLLDTFHMDLLVIERVLPGTDGCTIMRDLRSASFTVPALLITEGCVLEEKRSCIQAGADDFMAKPVDYDELVLRADALLRRSQAASKHKLHIGQMELDFDTLTVCTPQGNMILPKKEMCLLFKLLSSPARTFTREQLMNEFWGMSSEVDERTVDVHIKRLRQKFANCSDFKIVTVRGIGYHALVLRQK